jgi:hypothetical protein
MFEHLLGLKPWDLERMTTAAVMNRLEWIKDYQRQMKQANDGGRS